jgi:hypothetical protein
LVAKISDGRSLIRDEHDEPLTETFSHPPPAPISDEDEA